MVTRGPEGLKTNLGWEVEVGIRRVGKVLEKGPMGMPGRGEGYGGITFAGDIHLEVMMSARTAGATYLLIRKINYL